MAKGFGGFPGGNMQQLMRQAQKMQQDMQKIQQETQNMTMSASAGGSMVNVEVNGDIEYIYAYDRDTAHGLLFDKDQAEVYLIAHRRVRPDLISQGYTLTDVSFERVRRWDTWTYDIVYTYSKPIVKTNTTVKYNLNANLTKDGVINGYESTIDYEIIENEFKETIKDILVIDSEIEENIN